MGYTKEYEVAKGDRSFPARLKTLLNAEHMTQKDLAAYCGVSPASITGWMGGSEPDFDTLRGLARRFNVPIDYLLGISDNKDKSEAYQTIGKTTGLSDRSIDNLECLKLNVCVGSKPLMGINLITEAVSPRTTPTYTTNMLLENRDFLLLFYEYMMVESDASSGCFSNMKANSILISIQNELVKMRDSEREAIESDFEVAYKAPDQ